MARKRKAPVKPKTLSRQALQGQRGVNVLENVVLDMGSRWSPAGPNEVGIDGYVELFDPASGRALGTTLAAQSKAVGRFEAETPDTLEFTCAERDIDYWMQGNLPVILVVSCPATREAYWVSIKDYFSEPARRATGKVVFEKKRQRFAKEALSDLLLLGRGRDLGLYLAPIPREETLYTNLLELASMPERIYVARTPHRSPGQVWAALRSSSAQRSSGEWILRDKSILALFDLAERPWTEVCEEGTVEGFSTDEWSQSDDPDRQRQFVQLLGRALAEQLNSLGVRYWPQEDCFAFSGSNDRQIGYQALQRRSRVTVVKRFERAREDGRVFVRIRHLAFRGRFRRLAEKWYLEITPTYRFTWDGIRLDRFHADWLSGIKRIEGNRAVLSHVLLWSDVIARPQLTEVGRASLVFKLPETVVSPVGIDDGGWSARDPEGPPQEDADGDGTSLLPFPMEGTDE